LDYFENSLSLHALNLFKNTIHFFSFFCLCLFLVNFHNNRFANLRANKVLFLSAPIRKKLQKKRTLRNFRQGKKFAKKNHEEKNRKEINVK
jgi:hypothetical protein